MILKVIKGYVNDISVIFRCSHQGL